MRLQFKKLPLFLVLWFTVSSAWAQDVHNRPDIVSAVAPAQRSGLDPNWDAFKMGQIEALAMLTEMYPNSDLYFLARDMEFMGDLWKLFTGNDRRGRTLGISRQNIKITDGTLPAYLAQEGISEQSLIERANSGRSIVLVDTGWRGTIPTKMRAMFSARARQAIETHFITSDTSEIPSSRAFLSHAYANAAVVAPTTLHDYVIAFEHIPRYNSRSNYFENQGGTYVPAADSGSQRSGEVNPGLHLKYMEDLKDFASNPSTVAMFENRRSLWRDIYQTATKGDAVDLRNLLYEIIHLHPAGTKEAATMQAIVADAIELLRKPQFPVKGDGVSLQRSSSYRPTGRVPKTKLSQFSCEALTRGESISSSAYR